MGFLGEGECEHECLKKEKSQKGRGMNDQLERSWPRLEYPTIGTVHRKEHSFTQVSFKNTSIPTSTVHNDMTIWDEEVLRE